MLLSRAWPSRRRLTVLARDLLDDMYRDGELTVRQALRRLQAASEDGGDQDAAVGNLGLSDMDTIPDRPEWTPETAPSEREVIHAALGIPKARRLTPRFATVSIIGVANAGKSTLMNLLINNKVSAVSAKRNTTRSNTLGVYSKGLTQLVFTDTPGIVPPSDSKTLQRQMALDAWQSIQESDLGLLVMDAARSITPTDEFILNELASMDRREGFRLSLVLNKVDLVNPKHRLLPLAATLNQVVHFDKTFMISSVKNDGVADVKKYLIENANEGAWPFDSATVTDLSLGDRITEVIREALFHRLNQELPYNITLRHDGLRRNVDGSIRIDQVIFVSCPRHKQMVIGRGGQLLDWVRQRTRHDLSSLLGGVRVDLRLEVLVQKSPSANNSMQ